MMTICRCTAGAFFISIGLMFLHQLSPDAHLVQAQSRNPVPSFEVATVRPNRTDDGSTSVWSRDGRFKVQNLTLKQIMVIAYALQSDALISGSAETLLAQHYDINAKVDDQQEAAMAKMSYDERRGQTALMLQSLLAERFNLKVHWQKRKLPVYALVVAKDGPKFRPFAPQPAVAAASPQQTPRSLGHVGLSLSVNSEGAKLAATGEPIDSLARTLASQKEVGGRSVIDRTGMNGKYDYTMHWTPEQTSQTPKAGDNGLAQPVGGDGPSLFTALQDQLGLKLKAEKGEVETIVVDHVEQPTEN
jgi:uncharacterized protein (TIGR03435 family)